MNRDKHEDGHRRSTGKFWKSCVAFGISENTFLPAEQNLEGHIRVVLGGKSEKRRSGEDGAKLRDGFSRSCFVLYDVRERGRDVLPEPQLLPKPKPQWEELE